MHITSGSDGESSNPSAETHGRLRAVGVTIGITIAAIVVSVLGGVAFAVPLVLLEFDVQSTPAFLALTAVGQLGFLLVGYAYARYRGLRIRISLPNRRDTGYVVAGLVAALLAVTVIAFILQVLGLVPGSVIGDVAAEDQTVLLGLAVLSVVLVAPAEEFLFRGVIQGRLRQVFGPVGAVAGSSLLFGSIHLANYTGEIGAILAGALLIAGTGSVLGTVYERTRNLAVPIAVHAVYNAIQLVGVFYFT